MDARMQHAETLIDLRRAGEAEPLVRAALADRPDDVAALGTLGRALHQLERDAESADVLRRALALAPEDHWVHLLLLDTLTGAGRGEEALPIAGAALRLEPDLWTSHFAMARALLATRRPRTGEALQAAIRAVDLAPGTAAAHNLVGICLAGLNRRDDAERAYREALRLDPHHTLAMTNLASLDIERGRIGRGAGVLRTALGLAPTDQRLRSTLDQLLMALVRRLTWVLLGAGALVGVLVAVAPPWPVRAGVGVAVLVAVGVLVDRFRRRLPPGMTVWGRGLSGRVRPMTTIALALPAVLAVGMLLMALAPLEVARAVAVTLLVLLRVAFVVAVVGGIAGAVLSLVRRR